jgi:hypothetical protein
MPAEHISTKAGAIPLSVPSLGFSLLANIDNGNGPLEIYSELLEFSCSPGQRPYPKRRAHYPHGHTLEAVLLSTTYWQAGTAQWELAGAYFPDKAVAGLL